MFILKIVRWKYVCFKILIFLAIISHAQELQSDSIQILKNLQRDIFLHPGDQPTAYTLKKGEWIYAQSPTSLPFPSWAMVGLTDKITMELDLLPFFFGFFTPSRLPILSTNIQTKLLNQKNGIPSIANESMAFHIWNTITRYNDKDFFIKVKGTVAFTRMNYSWNIKKHLHIHSSMGVVYQQGLWLGNKDSINPIHKNYNNLFSPDFSVGIDYRPFKRISFYAAYFWGSTFTYIENIPNKRQFTYGFRLAPFYKSRFGFFRSLRAELVSIFVYFPDIDVYKDLKLPIYGYVYWQWTHKKRKKK